MREQDLYIGKKASKTKKITKEIINDFGEIIEDLNPLHMDHKKAEEGPFGKRIAHGAYGIGMFSSILAMQMPGEGTVYLEQNAKFLKPIYVEDTITAVVEIVDIINKEKGILKLRTYIENQDADIVVDGYAVVKVNKEIFCKN